MNVRELRALRLGLGERLLNLDGDDVRPTGLAERTGDRLRDYNIVTQ